MKSSGAVTPVRLLPPIPNEEAPGSGSHHSPAGAGASPRTEMSRFHSTCRTRRSLFMDWTSEKVDKNLLDTEEQDVTNYLNNHKDFLDVYVYEHVPLEVLEKWVTKKSRKNANQLLRVCPYLYMGVPIDSMISFSMSVNRNNFMKISTAFNSVKAPPVSMINRQLFGFKPKTKISKKQMFIDLLKTLRTDASEKPVMWALAKSLTISVGVDAFRVYKIFPDHPNYVQYYVEDTKQQNQYAAPKRVVEVDGEQVKIVLDVSKRGACLRLSRFDHPYRFPDNSQQLLKAYGIKYVKEANYVMFQPILNKSAKVIYIIEMWRVKERFTETDEEISSNFVVWGSLSIHHCTLYLDKTAERSMSDFLLTVVKLIFEEMISLDQLIKTILKFAQKLVSADRASLFLVDYRNHELVSTVFDLQYDAAQERDVDTKELRMPIDRGIAGHVAMSGETMNILNAYSDERFNREVDETTGYKTRNILCMPVKVEGRVIGVVQMVNKRNNDNFDHNDEASFETFATFFGLALYHARLYDKIMKKEQKYKVALEVLSYHNTCREDDVSSILNDKSEFDINLNNFYLDPFSLNGYQKCKSAIVMFNDLFDLNKFNLLTVTRFVLTVKKNYRTVPYHNFDHGWSVAHAMYVILKNDVRQRFDYKMRLALFVAALCHDLDHRGYTNKYMSETASPLAAMYTTSTLEHHHFNITVTILQQEGHNIFSHMSSDDYKLVLGYIRHCILATDLATFFPNLEKLKLLQGGTQQQKFKWSDSSHRDLAMAISMTAADLSASAKPWDIQIKTVEVIFKEFYVQGDKEREAGRTPIPMMDRSKPDEKPASQVGFLGQICIPCYGMLSKLLPNTKCMYTMTLKNLERWQTQADRILFESEQGKNEDIAEIGDEEFLDVLPLDKSTEPKIEEPDDDKQEPKKDEASKVDESIVDLKTLIVPWEADEDSDDEERFATEIWKDIEIVNWVDEEALGLALESPKPGTSTDVP